jgi:putative peptidoglycan lipid II flippase
LSAPDRQPRRTAVNTAIFSVATGLSRIAGLAREVVAARYFGTTAPMSAFTAAFQVPNLIRSLFADQALSAAFVPVFSELLEHRRRREALQLAGALFGLILTVLSVITVLFVLAAPLIMPLFTEDSSLDDLTVGLTQLMFPILVVLGLNGLVVGMLNAHDHFSVPALSPLLWNIVIIAALIALTPLFEGDDRIYAYAIGVLAGTAAQFAIALPVLRRLDIPILVNLHWRDPRIRRVLLLMLPVTIGLGLINFNLLINTYFGFRISEEAPAAIEKAFRIYMLPQGMFSVAVATVLFPALSRLVARQDWQGLRATQGNGMRQIALLLIPAAAVTIALPEPITRLVYERGEFDAQSTDQVAEALFWFSFSLPFSGFNLLLTRTFFSLQRPWTPTALAGVTLVINLAVSAALYEPLGIGGVVLGTVVSTAAMTVGQATYLRRRIGGLQLITTARATTKIVAASAVLGAVAYGAWYALDQALGDSLAAQLVAVGAALTLGAAVYAAIVLAMRIPEAQQIRELFTRRLRRS